MTFKRGLEPLGQMLGSSTGAEASVRSGDLFAVGGRNSVQSHEVFRTEPDDELRVPNVIKPAHGDVQDFFANVATYYPEHTPISAVSYVLSPDTAPLFLEPPGMRPRTITKNGFRRAYMGAAIGEATLAGLGMVDTNDAMSYAACKRTLAFSLGRSTIIHGSSFPSEALAGRWTKLRQLAGLAVSQASNEVSLSAHEIASGNNQLRPNDLAPPLRQALEAATKRNDDDDAVLAVLLSLYPRMERYIRDLAGIFDGRMAAFTQSVEAIQADSHGTRTDEFAVAFVCNRILPGSFAHVGILAKLVEFFPAALIWYGFLAAISKPSPNQQVNPGLLAKLDRDLIEPFSFEQRPRCDISFEELEVLSRGTLRGELVRPSHPRALLVALLPGVNVYTRFGGDVEPSSDRTHREHATDELHTRVSRLLEEALLALRRGDSRNVPTNTTANRRSRKDR